jgi:hypothetical protein
MRYAAPLLLLAFLAACDTTKPSLLNPDPVKGGDCKNGDQLCTLCRNADGVTWPCPNDYRCDGNGCLLDESLVGPGFVSGPIGASRGETWCDNVQAARAQGSQGALCPSRRGELATVDPDGNGKPSLVCRCAR